MESLRTTFCWQNNDSTHFLIWSQMLFQTFFFFLITFSPSTLFPLMLTLCSPVRNSFWMRIATLALLIHSSRPISSHNNESCQSLIIYYTVIAFNPWNKWIKLHLTFTMTLWNDYYCPLHFEGSSNLHKTEFSQRPGFTVQNSSF